jgi:hypothetical protein
MSCAKGPRQTDDAPPSGLAKTLTEGALRPLLGASILSSVGSLPLHLAPLIVATLIADSITSVGGAGWIPTAMLLGQLSGSLALPALKIRTVRHDVAIIAAIILLVGLAISSSNQLVMILIGWFLAGQCCGTLMYLGTIVASQFPRKSFAFSFRLAIVLILAGSVSSLLQATKAFTSYRALLFELILILVPILICGIMLHRPAVEERTKVEFAEGNSWTMRQFSGLATVYFFFVGQTGFLAYVVQQALAREMNLNDTVWSLAAVKVAAGMWLAGVAFLEFGKQRKERFLSVGVVLISAMLTVSYTLSIVVFFVALLVFEITLNALSAGLQAAVVAARPQFAGQWLTGVILLGAATGPPLNGLAISSGLAGIFLVISLLSALAPIIWRQFDAFGQG